MRIAIWTVVSMALVACGSAAPEPASDASVAPDGGALDCVAVLACAGVCDASDTTCVQACVSRGSPEAVTAVTALVTCANANACDDDTSCIETRCADEVAVCMGATVMPHEDAGMPEDEYPARIEGTTRDVTTAVVTNDSNGTVVFVRDDAAGEAQGFSSSRFVFYRLHDITYEAVVSSTTSGCVISADFTEQFTDPTPLENQLVIEREVGSDGLHAYGMSIGLNVNHPDGQVTDCGSLGITRSRFSSSHYVSHGTVQPRTDLHAFTGSFPRGPRESSWMLHGVD